MVFQNSDDQLFAPTVYQDVAFGPINLGFSPEKVKRYVGFALRYVGLCGYERRPPHHLSGGEKKRVAIAGILAMEPEVMILDEPTSNLDPASSEEIMDMLDELNHGGKTLIISTHDVELAYRWADEIILMKDGEVVRRGTGQEVFSDVDLIRDARLKQPLVVDIYLELMSRDIVRGSKPPRNILELCDLLQPKAREGTGASGKIYICDVDQIPGGEIQALIDRASVSFIGGMGTAAKALSERCSISLDFTYGVIDKCILKALTGKSALIMTSGGMVDHSQHRIQDYCRESGAEIEICSLSMRQDEIEKDMTG